MQQLTSLTWKRIKPNLASITLQQSEYNGNLASIKSHLGDGLTGLMVISMKPDIFKTIHTDAFEIPTNPVPAPDPAVIAAASTATKIADIYKAYALESAIYAKYVTAERCCSLYLSYRKSTRNNR